MDSQNFNGKSGFEKIFDTPDYTANTTIQDIEENKVVAVLSYFGILFLIPYLTAKNSKYAQFHANQGLVLFIAGIVVGVITRVVGIVFALIGLFFVAGIIDFLLGIALIGLWIMGIINSASGKSKELPLIGQFHILK